MSGGWTDRRRLGRTRRPGDQDYPSVEDRRKVLQSREKSRLNCRRRRLQGVPLTNTDSSSLRPPPSSLLRFVDGRPTSPFQVSTPSSSSTLRKHERNGGPVRGRASKKGSYFRLLRPLVRDLGSWVPGDGGSSPSTAALPPPTSEARVYQGWDSGVGLVGSPSYPGLQGVVEESRGRKNRDSTLASRGIGGRTTPHSRTPPLSLGLPLSEKPRPRVPDSPGRPSCVSRGGSDCETQTGRPSTAGRVQDSKS